MLTGGAYARVRARAPQVSNYILMTQAASHPTGPRGQGYGCDILYYLWYADAIYYL